MQQVRKPVKEEETALPRLRRRRRRHPQSRLKRKHKMMLLRRQLLLVFKSTGGGLLNVGANGMVVRWCSTMSAEFHHHYFQLSGRKAAMKSTAKVGGHPWFSICLFVWSADHYWVQNGDAMGMMRRAWLRNPCEEAAKEEKDRRHPSPAVHTASFTASPTPAVAHFAWHFAYNPISARISG